LTSVVAITTSFTKLVGVAVPIQLASMPGIATRDLVVAGAERLLRSV